MSKTLPPVTDFSSEEDPCEEPGEVQAAQALLAVDPSTKCNRMLEHAEGSIPVSDGTAVQHRTGAKADEIVLPAIQAFSGSFPRILAQNNAGAIGHKVAPEGCRPHILVGKEGSWSVQLLEQNSCWEDICECSPTQLAGFIIQKDCEGKERHCLVRFPIDDISGGEAATLFFASTSCIQKNGAGTEGDPYKFSIKISGDANNCIECRSDGLYVQCGVYGGSDPIDEL